MVLLFIGLIIFFAIHLVPSLPALKRGLTDWLGGPGYQMAFTVASLIGFLLIVWGKSSADFIYVYDPPAWGRHGTMMLVLVAFIFLAGYRLHGHIRKSARHPMLIAVALWSGGHLLANGDLASLGLFGGFLVYSIADIFLANAREPAPAFTPKARHDVIAVVGGIAVYIIILFTHPWAFGVAVI